MQSPRPPRARDIAAFSAVRVPAAHAWPGLASPAHDGRGAADLGYIPRMRLPCWVLTALLAPVIALADPAAESQRAALRAYQAKDYAGFLKHMRDVTAREPDLPRQIYNLAAAEALAGSPDVAIKLLHRLTGTGASFAIDKDDDFRGLRSRADFQAEVRAMKANLTPRGRADAGFTLRERELLTEGVAYDARTRTFFVSSVRHRKIVAVDDRGRQRDFITEAQDGIGGVFGMAVDPVHRTLWASSTALPHMVGYRPEDKGATALPASIVVASSFNAALAREAGVVLGREARVRGFNVVLGGIPTQSKYMPMPPFAGQLTDQNIADVTNYIRTSWGNAAQPNATAAAVAKIRATMPKAK